MRAHPWWSVFFHWASAFLWMKALAWAEKHSALPVDVEFKALNRWHTTSWHLESCAAGQHLQAFAFLRSRQTFLGWQWAFSWKLHFLLFQLLPLCSLVLSSAFSAWPKKNNKKKTILYKNGLLWVYLWMCIQHVIRIQEYTGFYSNR